MEVSLEWSEGRMSDGSAFSFNFLLVLSAYNKFSSCLVIFLHGYRLSFGHVCDCLPGCCTHCLVGGFKDSSTLILHSWNARLPLFTQSWSSLTTVNFFFCAGVWSRKFQNEELSPKDAQWCGEFPQSRRLKQSLLTLPAGQTGCGGLLSQSPWRIHVARFLLTHYQPL